MDKESVVYTQEVVLFSFQKEGDPVRCDNRDGPWGIHAQWDEPGDTLVHRAFLVLPPPPHLPLFFFSLSFQPQIPRPQGNWDFAGARSTANPSATTAATRPDPIKAPSEAATGRAVQPLESELHFIPSPLFAPWLTWIIWILKRFNRSISNASSWQASQGPKLLRQQDFEMQKHKTNNGGALAAK